MLVVSLASFLLAYLSPHWMIEDIWGYIITPSHAKTMASTTKGMERQLHNEGQQGKEGGMLVASEVDDDQEAAEAVAPGGRMGAWLGVWSARSHPLETLYLRRLVVLEGLAWGHGLAAGYLHLIKSIWNNHGGGGCGDYYAIITVLMAEFNSHRSHAATLQSLTQPGPITRAILLVTQVDSSSDSSSSDGNYSG